VRDRESRRPSAPNGRLPDAPVGKGDGDGGPDVHQNVLPHLAEDEDLLLALRGIGAEMFVTTKRLIVVRDGGERRPRSGVQTFALDAISHVRLEPGEGSSGRIAVRVGAQEAVSMFFDARSRDRAEEAVAIIRTLIARQNRERRARTPGTIT
jgi:hypothetical protein